MDSPEKVYQLFSWLGYKTLDPSYKGKEAWGLKEKDKESVKEIYAIANYEKRFQILLVELRYPSTSILKTAPLDLEKRSPIPSLFLLRITKTKPFSLWKKSVRMSASGNES